MENQNLSDQKLVEIIKKGDQDTFSLLVYRYQQRIFAYIYRFVGNKDDCMDIVQEVFIKVYKNLNSFDQSKEFSPWIYRISHNEAVNWLKKHRRFYTESIDQNEVIANTLKSSENIREKAETRELKIYVRTAVKKLPSKYQQVIELKYFEEKSYTEISRILKKPVNTVGTMINRAKKLLYKYLSYESAY